MKRVQEGSPFRNPRWSASQHFSQSAFVFAEVLKCYNSCPCRWGRKHPNRREGPQGRWPARNGGTEDSGQQDAEPALAGELEAIAEADRPRGASQRGGHGDIPRALRHLLAAPGPIRLPALASVLVRCCFPGRRDPASPS